MTTTSAFSKTFIVLLTGLVLISGCKKKKVTSEKVVYQNSFDNGNRAGITRAEISAFKGNKVLGFFNKHGLTLTLNSLPEHNNVEVSFDLYILDSWEGNEGGANGPDFWIMKIDDKNYLRTTFRNRPCGGEDCPFAQSYPAPYPGTYYPRTGSYPIQISGGCILSTEPDGGSLYRIVRLIPHSAATLKIDMDDELKQLGVPDDLQACDESWCVDNLVVKTVTVK